MSIEILLQETVFLFCQEEIDGYLQSKAEQGISAVTLTKYRAPLKELLQWLDGEAATAQKLKDWRKALEVYGYSKITIQKKVTVVNDFLRCMGRQELCIPKPQINELIGRSFGYLTVLEATEKRYRKDIIWRCRCKCGRETEVPTSLLLSGNTTSCGCLNTEILQQVNRYVEGTSLRQALEDRPLSHHSASGYTGVQSRGDGWFAYINYKGVRYNLGTYVKLEDAVKARARAKELVMEDAARLAELYIDQFGAVPRRPMPPEKKVVTTEPKERVKRSDNSSGCTGVTKQRGKWSASLSVGGYRYQLGAFDELEEAIAARKQAEAFAKAGDWEALNHIARNPR